MEASLMALLSFAGSPHGGSLKLLPEWQSQPAIIPTQILDHSIVGSALGAWWYFHDSTGIEAHFIVRGRRSGSADGHIWQLMDTGRQADANLQANQRAISIETEDDDDPDTQPWSAAQLASLMWLHNKLATVHPGIRRQNADTCTRPGLGYHSQLGAPSCRTPSPGKTCPGKPVRVDQWNRILLPAFESGTAPAPPPPPPPKEHDMFILRCDQTAGSAGRQLRLVNGQRHRIITSAERAELGAEGVVEHDVTGHPGLYDDVLSLAETTASTWTDDQLQELAERLAPLVAGRITIEGHPTLNITGVAVPAPTDAS